jgi:hypothetical protein
MRFFRALAGFAVVLSVLGLAVPATAATIYSADFSAAATAGDPFSPGYYYFVGHEASQTYMGTGLATVDELTLTLTPSGPHYNYATQPIGFTFYLNGFAVGTSVWNPGDSSAHALDFSFTPQSSASTEWTVLMAVTQPVCSGCGAIMFGGESPLTLVGTGQTVPEPTTLLLLGVGAAGFIARFRRRT